MNRNFVRWMGALGWMMVCVPPAIFIQDAHGKFAYWFFLFGVALVAFAFLELTKNR